MTFEKERITGPRLRAYAAALGLPIVSASYCGKTWNALWKAHKEPQFYGCGVYGWNYDVYILESVIVVCGYRPLPAPRLEAASLGWLRRKAAALVR